MGPPGNYRQQREDMFRLSMIGYDHAGVASVGGSGRGGETLPLTLRSELMKDTTRFVYSSSDLEMIGDGIEPIH